MSEQIKASDLISHLENIIKEYGDLPLVYSKDDEGNGFSFVYYTPTVGRYDEDDNEFITEDQMEDLIVNAICIN